MPATDLPKPGLGTMEITDHDQCVEAITQAVDVGYRHIDTAQKYGNEALVGDGIAAADVDREDLFVATKIVESNLAYDDVLSSAERSMEDLGLDVLDLLYIHWPAENTGEDRYDPAETIPAFNELLDDGAIRNVGVANFSVDLIEEAEEHFDAPIFANQVEMHPLLQQEELVAYAQDNDMYLVAYSPLVRGGIDDVPEVCEIAEKHDATPGQVSLAWLMSKDNVVPIPKSAGSHIRENFEARDLELDEEDVEKIESIDREERVVDAPKGPWNW